MDRRVRFWAILAVWLFTGPFARAETLPVKSAVVERVGLGGKFKVGQWTPFCVRCETVRPCHVELQVETVDPDGNRTIWPQEFDLDAAGTHHLAMLFQAGRLNVVLRPRLIVSASEGDQTWTIPVSEGETPQTELTHQTLRHDVLLVGTLGEPGGLSDGFDDQGEPEEEDLPDSRVPVHVAPFSNPSELVVATSDKGNADFTNSSGLEALDTLVISGRYDLTQEQSQAVKTWVTLGGHLILSVGEDLEAYQKSPLASWVSGSEETADPKPFRLTGSTSFLRLDTLESFAGKNAEAILIDRQNPIAGVKIEPGENAKSVLSVLRGPLIVRAPYGMGTVTVIGLSLSEDPVRSWSSLPQALRKLLLWDRKRPARKSSSSASDQLAYSGISELATQLQTALVSFPEVSRLSTWAIIGLMTAYLLVIGPLDYLLVHHLLGRPRLTWLTFPALIVAAAVFSSWMAKNQNGRDLLVSQVDVVDYDVSTRMLRSRSWASIYSPETRRYQVALEPGRLAKWTQTQPQPADPPDLRMSWFGTPETSFGGMYREGGQQIQPPQYRFSPQAKSVENLPIPIWGAKSITGQWCRKGTVWVESDLESPRTGQLRGSIRHSFPVPITDWFLAYHTRVFLPRVNQSTGEAEDFLPRRSWPRRGSDWNRVNQRDISGFLTKAVAKRFLREDATQEKVQSLRMEQQPYEPLAEGNPDPLGDIVRMLTFHREVGGKQYTGLDNHAFRQMDLSGRLGLDQAVLFGRLDLSATELKIKDQTPKQNERATFVRIVLPVKENHPEDTGPFPSPNPAE